MLDFNFLVTDFDILLKLLNYFTLRYITVNYITLHYITLHLCTSLRFNLCPTTVDMKHVTNIHNTHSGLIKGHFNMSKNIK